MDTPIYDRLIHVLGVESHASSPRRRKLAGGEWDAWYALSRKQRRKLIGSRWAVKGGMPPDVLAELINRTMGFDDYKQALEWFYHEALAAIPERRKAANRDARYRLVKGSGHLTYFHYRNAMAISAGYQSYWYYRRAMNWPEQRQQGERPLWTQPTRPSFRSGHGSYTRPHRRAGLRPALS